MIVTNNVSFQFRETPDPTELWNPFKTEGVFLSFFFFLMTKTNSEVNKTITVKLGGAASFIKYENPQETVRLEPAWESGWVPAPHHTYLEGLSAS